MSGCISVYILNVFTLDTSCCKKKYICVCAVICTYMQVSMTKTFFAYVYAPNDNAYTLYLYACAYMYNCIRVCKGMCVCVCVYVCVCVCVRERENLFFVYTLYGYMYVCICFCRYMYLYISLFVYLYTCIYIYVCWVSWASVFLP